MRWVGKGEAIERVKLAAGVEGEDGWRGRGKGLQAEQPIIAAVTGSFFASLSQSKRQRRNYSNGPFSFGLSNMPGLFYRPHSTPEFLEIVRNIKQKINKTDIASFFKN